MKELRVLFITHDTSRTGAPLLLLNFIKWVKKNDLVTPYILIGRSAEMDHEFSDTGTVFFSYNLKNSIGRNLLFKVYVKFYNSKLGKNLYNFLLKIRLKYYKIDLIYSNTICNGEEMDLLSVLNVKQICHVHEGKSVIDMYGISNLNLVKKNTTHFIACSKFVRNTLVTVFNFEKSNIDLIYESIDRSISKKLEYKNCETELDKLKSFVIGGSGGLGFRKGTDLIIPLMKELLKYRKDICFVWVGGNKGTKDFTDLEGQIFKNGLTENVYLVSSVFNPMDYFKKFNLFTLLSREDPFPLVCLENAILGKPVLCFESSGGIPELLEECSDNVISYLDIEKMARRILFLMKNKNEANKIGICLQKKVLNNFTTDICFPKMYKVIKNYYNAS